jgi:hypothetical protein
MASTFTSPAKFIVFRVLRLRRQSLLARYIYAAIVFFLSGCMHVCGEVTAGIPLWESGVIQIFTTQALGLLIEDLVKGFYGLLVPDGGGGGRRGGDRARDGVAVWKRVVGFVWVSAWMAWSMPVWTYPATRRSQGEGVLPFSFVERLRG